MIKDKERLLTDKEAAEWLGCSKRMLSDWRRDGGGPNFVRLSPRKIMYRVADLALFAESKVDFQFGGRILRLTEQGRRRLGLQPDVLDSNADGTDHGRS